MKLKLVRETLTEVSTIGSLYVDGVFECYILEDKDRRLEEGGEKVYGRTAIPLGTYEVIVDMSNRFKRLLPLVRNVPQFSGIRIHPGNTDADTEGCLLPGTTKGADKVLNSRTAFDRLFKKIQEARVRGEAVTLEVTRL